MPAVGSRAVFYQHGGGENEKNLRLMCRIDGLYAPDPTWGSRKMSDRLSLEGQAVNRKRDQRLMRMMGLQAICHKRHLSRPLLAAKIHACVLRDNAVVRQAQQA